MTPDSATVLGSIFPSGLTRADGATWDGEYLYITDELPAMNYGN